MKALSLAMLVGCATTTGAVARTDYADIHGLRMYYEDHGAGRPLVLLHGGGSTAQTTFGAIIPALARTHRVIAPEQQAHGHTADIDRPLSFEQMADDTATLLERLGVRDADVIGFSNGGIVAMQIALRHPHLVRRLVLCSTIYSRAGLPDAVWKAFERPDAANMPAALRDAYLAVAPQPGALQTMVEKTCAMMLRFRELSREVLAALTMPVLVMTGDTDISPEHSMQLARLLPKAELAVFPGSGHGTYLGAAEGKKPGTRQPELAVAMIEEFLAR